MFSVDNFYTYFNDLYGFDQTGITPFVARPHGSKNLGSFLPFGMPATGFVISDLRYRLNGCAIMHDQELFDWHYSVNTYRNYLVEVKKNELASELTDEEIVLWPWKSLGTPIFCHSEINSEDVEKLERQGMISAYYFWHALISRDWFRHWRYAYDLEISMDSIKANRFVMYIRDCTGSRSYRSKVKEALVRYKDQILCDWDGATQIGSDASALIVKTDAQISSIHVVAETLFESQKVHVTEKCFKPIVMRQPFIAFAAPGTLAYLRSYGFRTFSDVWDESYDLETDHDIRLAMVIRLIDQLLDMHEKDFQLLIHQCSQSVMHNVRHFFSQEFEDLVLEELHKNMQNALEIQTLLRRQNPGGTYFDLLNRVKSRKIELPFMVQSRCKKTINDLRIRFPLRYSEICKQYPWVKNF
jgi:hypothetical protein